MTDAGSAPSLGEYLRQEREKRGITIEQVASATKVGVKMLHALEADQYAELPAKPFIRGFVTSYARFVGLDSREILTRFHDFIEKKAHDRPARDAGHSGYAFEKREAEQSRMGLWIVMAIFAVFGAVAFIFFKKPHHHGKGSQLEKLRASHQIGEQAPAQPPAPTGPGSVEEVTAPSAIPSELLKPTEAAPSPLLTPSQVAVATPSPTPTLKATPSATVAAAAPTPAATVASPMPSPTPDKADPLNSGKNLKFTAIKHKIIVKALNDVRVRYQSDNRPITSFILRRNSILVVRAQSTIKFSVTNPKSVSVNYNGQPEKPMSEIKSITTRQNDATLFFPAELADSVQEPFPGERPLSGGVIPKSPTATPAPVSSP